MRFSRVENLLGNITLNETNPIEPSQSRLESILLKMLNENADIELPQSRYEELFKVWALNNDSTDYLTTPPFSRVDAILQNILGANNELESPQSRLEELLMGYLSQIEDLRKVVHIEVTTLPIKTEYEDGETIDFTGLEVTGYKEDGSVWGIIPFDQLVFPVTIASKE